MPNCTYVLSKLGGGGGGDPNLDIKDQIYNRYTVDQV